MKSWATFALGATMLGTLGLGMQGSAGSAMAAEIIILANQGALSAVRDLAPAFEKASGHKVVVNPMQGASASAALKSDAAGDVVSTFYESFDGLVKDGQVV